MLPATYAARRARAEAFWQARQTSPTASAQ